MSDTIMLNKTWFNLEGSWFSGTFDLRPKVVVFFGVFLNFGFMVKVPLV